MLVAINITGLGGKIIIPSFFPQIQDAVQALQEFKLGRTSPPPTKSNLICRIRHNNSFYKCLYIQAYNKLSMGAMFDSCIFFLKGFLEFL